MSLCSMQENKTARSPGKVCHIVELAGCRELVDYVHYLDEVLGSSISGAATDAKSIPSLSGESEIRRSCTHTEDLMPMSVSLLVHVVQRQPVADDLDVQPAQTDEDWPYYVFALTCLLKSALICSSRGSMSLHQADV